MEEYNKPDVTLRDYVRILFHHKGVIVATIGTVMALVIFAVLFMTDIYEAQVKMLISGQKQVQADYYTDIGTGGMRSVQINLTQSEIVSSDPVIERAVSVLGLAKKPFDYEKRFSSKLKKPIIDLQAGYFRKKIEKMPKDQKEAFLFRLAMEDLRQRMKVDPVRDTDLFVIKVKDYNPLGAAVTANVVSRSFVIFDLEQQLAEMKLKYGEKNVAVTQLMEAIEKLTKDLNGAPLDPLEAIGPASVKIIEQAKVPLKPAGISKTLTIILAFFISIFLAGMMAFSYEYMDQTFKSPCDAETFLKLNYLGFLPRKPHQNHYQDLCEQLHLIIKDKKAKSFLFVSVLPFEELTSIIATLGSYIGEHANNKILLIDGNLRTPSLHKRFRLPTSKDLINVLEEKESLENSIKPITQNVHVLSSGPSSLNPVTVLESRMMKELLKQAADIYDLVLIASAPLAKFKDATLIAGLADGVILIIDERQTRRQVTKIALEALRARKAKLLGFILNNRRFVIPKFIYDRV